MSSNKTLWAIIGIFLSVALAWLAFRNLDWEAVWQTLHRAEVFPWVPTAVLLYLTGQFVRGLRCKMLVGAVSQISLMESTNIVATGYAVNNILPARAGEIARVGMLAEVAGLPIGQSLTVVFVERVFDGLTMVFLALISCWWLGVAPTTNSAVWLLAAFFLGLVCAIFVVVVAPGAVMELAARLGALLPQSWVTAVFRTARNVCQGVEYLRSPRRALFLVGVSLLVWMLESAMFLFLLPAFGLEWDFLWAVFVMSVTNLGILLPSSPGFIGTFHFFCFSALVTLGVPREAATAYAVCAHLAFFIPITVWGLAALCFYGSRLGSMLAAVTMARRSPSISEFLAATTGRTLTRVHRAVIEKPSPFLRALVESLAPATETLTSEELRHKVVNDVSTFVNGELYNLPKKLKIILSLGLLFFRFSVWVRQGRGFSQLSQPSRRKIVEGWAFGRVPLFRQLFRPVHSLVVLGLYEDEKIKETLMTSPTLGVGVKEA